MDPTPPALTEASQESSRWRAWRIRAGSLFQVAIFALALYGLHLEWQDFRIGELKVVLFRISAGQVALALAFTFLSYFCHAAVGLLAQRSQAQPSRGFGRDLLHNFLITASTRTAGATAGGGSGIRQRFAAEQRFPASKIDKISVFAALVSWAGQALLTGLLLELAPPAFWLSEPLWRTIGGVLLLCGGTLVGLRFRIPTERPTHTSLLFLATIVAIAALDWLFAGLAMRILLAGPVAAGLWPVIAVLTLAHGAAALSTVPGELGVFEFLVTKVAGAVIAGPVLAAALISYRLIYYLLPFAAASLVLGVRGRGLRSRAAVLEQGGRAALRGWSMIAPRIASWLALAGGFLLLLSANTPMEESRRGIVAVLPLPFVEASHFVSSLSGALLIVLARGLQRRIRTAWWLSVVAMASGMVFSLAKGFDWEEALALGFLLVCLLTSRDHFHRHGALWTHRFTLGWWLTILSLAGVTVWMGFFAARHIPYQHELWWRFALEGDASRFLRAMTGAAVVFAVVALAQSLRPAKPRQPPPAPDQEAIDRLVRASDHADAVLAYLGDKQFALSPCGGCALMYADQGRSRIVMGDPLGDSDAAGDLLWQFVEQAQDEGMRPVFFQVSVSEMPRLVDMGFKLYKLGEEARVPLAKFTIEGSVGKKFRHARSRFQRDGLTFELWPPSEVAANLEPLRVVSDAWLAQHRAGEKGFSLGRFDPAFITRFPAAAVKDGSGRIVAFATLWLTENREELSVDLMRHLPDAPHGTMEGLFVEIILWGKEQGFAHFNLGMAPLSGLSTPPLAPVWHQLAAMIFHRGESLYNFRGVRGFKDKFAPVWEPRYLAVPGSWSLPTALLDTTALIGGGLRKTLGYKP